MPEATCKVDGCARAPKTLGWCLMHYTRVRRHGDPHFTLKRFGQGTCAVDRCERKAIKRGWCDTHYQRWRTTGTTDPPPRRAAEKRICSAGYVHVLAEWHPYRSGEGRVAEHRLVMEEQIGRLLQPEETVHHKNGDRSDNRLSNLELWISSHPPGQRVSDKVEWATEFLQRYAPERLR